MGAAVKLIMPITTQRLQNVYQGKGIIRRWQAGFMRNEEWPMQVASLFDIAARRQALGLPTYAGSIDSRKAYDTVPRELLFLKLQAIGVTGHMLTFIKLYAWIVGYGLRQGGPGNTIRPHTHA